MAQIIYSARALSDLERLIGFLLEADVPLAQQAADLIIEAVEILANTHSSAVALKRVSDS